MSRSLRVRPRRLSPLGLYRVDGDSMRPTYTPGALLLGWRWFRPRTLRPGRVIIAWQAGRPVLKRLEATTPAGRWLAGDNPPASTDSRHYGPINTNQVEAIIIIWPVLK